MAKHTKRILIIDDEKDLVDILYMRLINDGYLVDKALDGIEGIEKVNSFKPDYIFLDISMPGISGWEVCEKLKNDDKTKHIKIIIFTATREIKLAKKTGADRVMLKPFNYDEVLSVIKS